MGIGQNKTDEGRRVGRNERCCWRVSVWTAPVVHTLWGCLRLSICIKEAKAIVTVSHRYRVDVVLCILVLALPSSAWQSEERAADPHPVSGHAATQNRVVVPEKVAALLRPVLDQLQQRNENEFVNSFYKLTQQKGASVDEAVIVLMCFYVGESQEEIDAVIKHGRRMLVYINKYRHRTPSVPGRKYPDSMLKPVPIRNSVLVESIDLNCPEVW